MVMARQKQRKCNDEVFEVPCNQFVNVPYRTLRTQRGSRNDRDYMNYLLTTRPNTQNSSGNNMPLTGEKVAPNTTRMRRTVRAEHRSPAAAQIMRAEKKDICKQEREHDVRNKNLRQQREHEQQHNKEHEHFHAFDNPTHCKGKQAHFQAEQQKECRVKNKSNHNMDKDDDTEEFFDLIRHTVQNAIGKSVSDIMNHNFRELNTKIDSYANELKAINLYLDKVQTELSNKIVHYGEENSRHFRYLCMKSEYDKMFYQHQLMVPNGQHKNAMPIVPSFFKFQEPGCNFDETANDTTKEPCCCSNSKLCMEPRKTSSDDHSELSDKSSDAGMRKILKQIKHFCNQMQVSLPDLKHNKNNSADNIHKDDENTFKFKEALRKNKHILDHVNDDMLDNDDDENYSSDGMTPRANYYQQNGGDDKYDNGGDSSSASAIARRYPDSRANGAGDA